MNNEKTFELKFTLTSEDDCHIKSLLKDYLIGLGEESFVEGALDDLDFSFDYEKTGYDYFKELGGDRAPLMIYKYDRGYLEQLKDQAKARFGDQIEISISSIDTVVWQEGWKDSFKPIVTDTFCIFPPWDKPSFDNTETIGIEIDPGMAFGTGQHATTQLCLEAMSEFLSGTKIGQSSNFLDVGSGSGVLAIGAAKLGFPTVDATDIDPDSVIACSNNRAANDCTFNVELGTFPTQGEKWSVVTANILAVVLKKIASGLVDRVAEGGLLFISGILVSESEEMVSIFESLAMKKVKLLNKDEWVCIVLRKT